MTASRVLSWTPAAIVFDCDGTLMDTERHWQDARSNVLGAYGFAPAPDFAERAKGLHYTECGCLMAAESGHPELGEVMTGQLLAEFRALVADNPLTMPGARALVQDVSRFAPLAVASNCPAEVVESCLETAGLREYFDHLVVPDETIRPKPHPDVYLTAAGLCGVEPSDTLAIEDSLCGVQAAVRAGMRVLGAGPRPSEETEALTDLWVRSLDDPELRMWACDRVPSQA
ncbi:hydrolase [Streptomyces sp. 150FB]|uniref:HAD family hydrolase n=1 Tax=Streptomyces sp. 150FB TaxID=1576605 RepID=UPI00058968CF|nr:HAD family phosphatase [Streptomyces sp. 150FB]KIF77647.1 hydrolase [Streptomyces sp. 150FB]